MLPLPRKAILTCCCMSLALSLVAQKPDGSTVYNHYAEEIRYIREAPQLLPRLAQEGAWTQMRNYLAHWSISEYADPELIFCFTTLLDIETQSFSAWNLPPNYTLLTEKYATEMKKVSGANFHYYIKLKDQTFYDATPDARALLLWAQSWAGALSGRPGLSGTELFFCQVFAGKVTDPRSALARSPAKFSDLYALDERIDSERVNCQTTQRDGSLWTVAVLAGVWIPTGNLSALGNHPSIGLSIGKRNKWNEYDVVWAFRFVHPTPQTYTFVRNDTLYNSNYYDGGYIGFDYTRYLVHVRHWDVGLLGAFGYDYFSVASGFSNSGEGAHWGSLNQGSMDVNFGLHLKYLFGRKANNALGLVLKYHCINYENNGGTDLGGNALTLDISYGLR